MDIYRKFVNRTQIDLTEDLRTSKNLEYILAKEAELKIHSEKVGVDCVIGIWGYPYPRGKVAGYGIHTRYEAESILKKQAEKEVNFIWFSRHFYDLKWFRRKILKLRRANIL